MHYYFFFGGLRSFPPFTAATRHHIVKKVELSQHMLLHEISNFPFVAFQLKIIISCSSYTQNVYAEPGATTSALTVIDISQQMDNGSLNF